MGLDVIGGVETRSVLHEPLAREAGTEVLRQFAGAGSCSIGTGPSVVQASWNRWLKSVATRSEGGVLGAENCDRRRRRGVLRNSRLFKGSELSGKDGQRMAAKHQNHVTGKELGAKP